MNTLLIFINDSNPTNIDSLNDEELKKYNNAIELKNKYNNLINIHNQHILSLNPNAGFDLLNPFEIDLENYVDIIYKLNTGITCAMIDTNNVSKSYYLYPRSSISKTPLRFANNVGIIDSGYRGNIIGMFDILQNDNFKLDKYSRLLQICSGNLEPFYVKLVENIEELGITERNTGGFGSTGI